MDQENKEEFEQENEAQSPGDIDENESITEFISNMNFVNIEPFSAIPDEEMMTTYKNDVFWYVFDETTQLILAHPVKGQMEPRTYLFQDKDDAETWRYIGSKSGTHQDHNLIVEGAKFVSFKESLDDTLGEFRVFGVSHAEAQNVFENYPEIRLTREVEERRKLNRDSEEDDNF